MHAPYCNIGQAHYDRETLTNRINKMCNYTAIYPGCSGIRNGTLVVFDLETGAVKNPHKFTVLPMSDTIVQKVTAWGRKFQKENLKNKIEFLNRNREWFDWDNDDLEDADEGLVEGEVPRPRFSR